MTTASCAGVKKPARKTFWLPDAPLELGPRSATCSDPSGDNRVRATVWYMPVGGQRERAAAPFQDARQDAIERPSS